MTHKQLSLALASTLVALAFLAASPARAKGHHGNVTISTDGEHDITACSQVKIEFDGQQTARTEQKFTLAKKDVSRLTMHLDSSSGISVVGWDRDNYGITACKAGSGSSESAAQQRLGEISISADGGHLTMTATGESNSWLVYFIVQAPRAAVLDMQSENGGINFRHVSGTIDARATNGPVSLRDCSGVVRAETTNGPIEFTGGSGDFHLSARNGPMSVRLTGTKWDGAGLDASSENGPLSVRVPDAYDSGVSVESRGHSPFSCKAPACNESHGDWGDGNRGVRMGGDNPVVRLRTVNGPVEIKSAGARNANHDSDDTGTD